MIKYKWYPFSELPVDLLYSALALRSDVFVIEQSCIYKDIDERDPYAIHLVGVENNELVAYLRLFPPTDIENYLVFGRVVTARTARGKGHGKQLLTELLNYCNHHFPGITINCSAQFYLKKFYESFGFKTHGEVYEEDGIPHIAMSKNPMA